MFLKLKKNYLVVRLPAAMKSKKFKWLLTGPGGLMAISITAFNNQQ